MAVGRVVQRVCLCPGGFGRSRRAGLCVWILLLMLALVFTAGCTRSPEPDPVPGKPAAAEDTADQEDAAQAPADDWNRGETGALADAEELLEHLRAGDREALASFLRETGRDDVDAQSAADVLMLFEHHFDLTRLEVELLRFQEGADRTVYELALLERQEEPGQSPQGIPLWIHHRRDAPQRVLDTPFVTYGLRLAPFLDRYLDLIRAGDASQLARLLTPDDEDYPVEKAEELLHRYRQETRVESLGYRFAGFSGIEFHDGYFIGSYTFGFVITGEDARGEALAHEVEIRVGDGLMGLYDPWKPDY